MHFYYFIHFSLPVYAWKYSYMNIKYNKCKVWHAIIKMQGLRSTEAMRPVWVIIRSLAQMEFHSSDIFSKRPVLLLVLLSGRFQVLAQWPLMQLTLGWAGIHLLVWRIFQTDLDFIRLRTETRIEQWNEEHMSATYSGYRINNSPFEKWVF